MIEIMEIRVLDLHHQGVPKTIAAFLVIGPADPILVETGPESALETLIGEINRHGYSVTDIKNVLVTHIHFDHAGSAGWWAQQGAHVYVHSLGAKHLIDPSRLVTSAKRIYGDKMDTLWGTVLPAPAERVTSMEDGDFTDVSGLSFQALETPGHAWHHHVFRIDDIAFVGDAAGVRLFGSPLVNLPAPPPEFNLEAWYQTIDRLISEDFRAIYLTHFGRLEKVSDHFKAFKALLGESAEFVRERMLARVERNEIVRQYEDWNRQRARDAGATEEMIGQYETANPLYMSVDGIMRYWNKKEDKSPAIH
jgi:glyoxylase-like metal-dependent hydrolase (beta-lactamase superfamily II)